MRAGMDAYLAKPIHEAESVNAVAKIAGSYGKMAETPTQPQDGAEVLNWSAALEATDGDEKLLLELVSAFLDEAPAAMSGIRQCIELGDTALLRRWAHTLKSSLRIFEAPKASDFAWQIELIGKKPEEPDPEEVTDEDWKRAAELRDLLSQHMPAVLAAMKERAKS